MDFSYMIEFTSEDGISCTRSGKGLFYPSDCSFQLEHMLWLMAEQYGRPTHINVTMNFTGNDNGTQTPKRLEGPKTEA